MSKLSKLTQINGKIPDKDNKKKLQKCPKCGLQTLDTDASVDFCLNCDYEKIKGT